MRLTMQERKKATAIVAPRYQKARKKERGTILTEFIELMGHSRCYASYVLRSHGKKVRVNDKQVLIGDIRKSLRRKRARIYDSDVSDVLKKVWYISGLHLRKETRRDTERSGSPIGEISGDKDRGRSA